MPAALTPTLLPLGDQALLVRYADTLSDAANLAAVALARQLAEDVPEGVEEVAPGLVSVLLRLTPGAEFAKVRGEVMLRLGHAAGPAPPTRREIAMRFDGEDLPEVAALLRLTPAEFVRRHNEGTLRVLATGFAPGFVYCGFHGDGLVVPRREAVRPMVPAGTVLFAAGQTAIAATPIRTGWHVIGRTEFQNFDPSRSPPTALKAGDDIRFIEAS
jgi:KipI family sensor histidine kinase inhibitor